MSAPAGTEPHRRLLLIAYRFDPDFSMESRLAWHRAVAAAQQYRVTVLCALEGPQANQAREAGIDVLRVAPSRLERLLARVPGGSAAAYAAWRRRAFRAVAARHQRRPFDVVHHVSYCGYRQPSLCWKLGVPYIWGPIGGTHAFPARFLGAIAPAGAVREAARNVINALQLRWSPAVRAAMHSSHTVLAASEQARRELTAAGHAIDGVMLETGVQRVADSPRPPRDADAPLKILWAGRACSWKALPLLLRALAQVDADCTFQLRVMAAGPRLRRWRREAAALGLDDRVEWVGWPGCAQREPHYQWADALAFTSLRDTSGTGLLEALAAGAPVIGLDHQGAADVLTDRCAITIPVTTPRAAIDGFRLAVERLAGDSALLARLSAGALERARDYLWDVQSTRLLGAYDGALASAHPAQPSPSPRPAQPDRLHKTSPTFPSATGCANGSP